MRLALFILGVFLVGCGVAVVGAEAPEAETTAPTAISNGAADSGGGGAPYDFDEDGIEEYKLVDAAGDDDAPEAALPPPPPPPPPPAPLLAQADDDDSAEAPRKDEVDTGKIVKDLAEAKKPKDHVKIEQKVIEEGIEDAEELNDELAEILEQLRREEGLEEEDPYVSPIQQAVEPIIQAQQELPKEDEDRFREELQRALEKADEMEVARRKEREEEEAACAPDPDPEEEDRE
jgi:hypothetical protein